MNTHLHRRCSRRLLAAGVALVVAWAMSYGPIDALAETAPVPATPAPATPAPVTPAPAPAPAPASAPEKAAPVMATAEMPAILTLERPATAGDTFLDINVQAFTPPRQGAAEAVVSLEEPKEGGREVEVGRFTIFPAATFEAKEAKDEHAFRLDATKALAELGGGGGPVKVKVRLEPLLREQPTAGASLTLGKVQFAPREEPK